MKKILELIIKIKANPKDFIDEPKLGNLSRFISGYDISFIDFEDNGSFFSINSIGEFKFYDFICEIYHENSSKGWERIIVENTNNQKEAFYKFYELLENYLKIVGVEYNNEENTRNHTDKSFVKMFDDILKRPAIYVGSSSIERIYYFLKGYLYQNDIEVALEFYDFLTTKFGKTDMLYYEYLLSIFHSDEIAIKKVRIAWEEFKNTSTLF